MEWTTLFLLMFLCLCLEAFFSGSELAIVSSDKMKLNHLASKGKKGAQIALKLVSRPERFFSTTLLGQNLFIVGNSVLVTFFIYDRYGPEYELWGMLLSPIILIFGEAVPKSLCQHWADRLAPKVAPAILVFSYVLSPLVWPLSKLTHLLMGGLEDNAQEDGKVTRESLEHLLRESEAPRELAGAFKQGLLKVLDFTKKQTHEIMTPLIEVFSLSETSDVEEAIMIIREEGYSHVPIFRRRAYNIVGVVKYSDLMFATDLKAPVGILMQEPFYVPPSMPIKDLFSALKQRNLDFAVVVDEFGATSGIVTLEDILEEVVGEIEDEYDERRITWKATGPAQYLVEGRVSISELNEKLKLGLPKGDYETIAGFILSQMGRFPQSGDSLHWGRLTIMVKTATSRSVEEALIEIEP